MNIVKFVKDHIVGVGICLWSALVVISFMPSPNGTGFYGSPTYKWIWGVLHFFAGALGRISNVAAKLPFPLSILAQLLPNDPTRLPNNGGTKQ